jgi:hypothetical protein
LILWLIELNVFQIPQLHKPWSLAANVTARTIGQTNDIQGTKKYDQTDQNNSSINPNYYKG